MKRKDCKDKNELARLDKINNERVENTKNTVIKAIRKLNNPIQCMLEDIETEDPEKIIAKVISNLESANEEMKWTCEWFEWNDDVCYQIDDACADLGICLAILLDTEDEEYDINLAGSEGRNGIIKLSKVLSTLITWFDEDES